MHCTFSFSKCFHFENTDQVSFVEKIIPEKFRLLVQKDLYSLFESTYFHTLDCKKGKETINSNYRPKADD